MAAAFHIYVGLIYLQDKNVINLNGSCPFLRVIEPERDIRGPDDYLECDMKVKSIIRGFIYRVFPEMRYYEQRKSLEKFFREEK